MRYEKWWLRRPRPCLSTMRPFSRRAGDHSGPAFEEGLAVELYCGTLTAAAASSYSYTARPDHGQVETAISIR